MAGHSHWAGIKHKKAAVDAKRGKLWSKLSRAIIVAAKTGGGDPETNPRLRQAIADAKAANMPNDNITRAIKKGTGELASEQLEEIVYEGYGPGGVAVLCEILTDNRNRTASEVRKLFERHGGKLGTSGCVAWQFHRKGLFIIPADQTDEDTLVEVALEAEAEDVKPQGEKFEVFCDPAHFEQVAQALQQAGITPELKQITLIPETTVDLDAETGRKVLKLLEALDDHDDVQNVVANFNIPEEVMAELET